MNNELFLSKIKEICPKAKKYEFYKNAVIYKDENDNKHVVKENKDDALKIYNYLNYRGFSYLPKLEYLDKDIYIYKYEEDLEMPKEQRMSDLIKTSALLHNKTVYYKDISVDEVKELYEYLSNKIVNTYNYYDDIMNIIESNIYMSPSSYMLARNCSMIFNCLEFSKNMLDDWYKKMEKTSKKRIVLLHNNLNIRHLIRNDENILISWNNSKRGLPIYDFINLYKNNFADYDFNELYYEYKKRFPLTKEEEMLIFIYLFIPDKLNLTKSEMAKTIDVARLCNYLVTTDKLFMEQEAENTKEQKTNVNK